jgi:serine/threonine protein kinase
VPAVATAAGLPSRLGKYELLLPLAAGGMARIYIGRSTGIGSFERHVVLKMITPERANDLTAVNMFLDEARLAASLNHQNVAQVFEVGEDLGIHYLAMEYVHGQDLRAVLAKAGSQGTRIPLELALTVVAGAAAGLNHAHERRGPDGTPLGIVHRDVSPSNIMIGYDGAVKLLDFGIAKATARSVETQSGIIKGKFAYMAPEQCRGRDVDRRSDVFSLGIILYEISTQHRCFRADSDFDTMHRIVTGDVVRPTRLVQGYPQALEAIVMKALAVDASQRYQSAGLLLEALESFAVSSRMSLSTMGLGRFMRDMFGEVQEPWLNTAATKVLQPIVQKESTISQTNGQGSQPRAPSHLDSSGIPDEEAAFPDSAKAEAAKTILDLPRGPAEREQRQDEVMDWNAKSYPAPQPAPESLPYSGRHSQPAMEAPMMISSDIDITPLPMQPMTHTGPLASQDLPLPPPPHQFNVPGSGSGQAHQFNNPGSGSGQAHPYNDSGQFNQPFNNPGSGSGSGQAHPYGTPGAPPIVSTKHGYTSGAMSRGDVSYPRYEVPIDQMTSDVQLTPNRRPLFIGLGIVAAGVIVMLVVSLTGNDDAPSSAPAETEQATETETGTEPDPTAKGSDTDVVDDNMVSVIIHSEPIGADVLIAGAKLGVTPFESKLKRGTKIAPLTVQKEGFAPFNGKIDLGGEYENRNIKLIRLEDMPNGSDGSAAPGNDKGSADAKGATTKPGTAKTGATSSTGTTSTTGTAAKTGTDKAAAEKLATDKAATDKTGTAKTGTEKTGATTKSGTDKTVTKSGTDRSGTTKTGSEKTTRTGTEKSGADKASTKTPVEKTTPKVEEPKCQPPGPNVDPFGLPVCKT